MTPTRPHTLVAVAVVCAAAAWLAVRASYASLPPLPWTAIPALLLLAFGEVLIGHNLAARRRGRRSGKPLEPMAVARLAALAKASSVVAAIFGGSAAGFAGYVLGSLDKTVARHDAIAGAATLAAAVALLAAALYLEHSCRAPRPPDTDQAPPPRG